MLDFVAVLLIGVLGFVGWRTGFAIMAVRLGGFIAGGALASVGTQPLAAVLARVVGWRPIPAHAVALFALIGFGLLLGTSAEWWIRRRRRPAASTVRNKQQATASQTTAPLRPRKRPQRELSTVERSGGAALGLAWGVSLTLVMSWALLMLGSLTDEAAPHLTNTRLGHAAAGLAGQVTYQATLRTVHNDALASIAAAVARDPQHGVRSLQEVLNNQAVQRVLADQDVRRRLIETSSGGVAPEGLASLLEEAGLARHAYQAGVIHSDPSHLDDAQVLTELGDGLRPIARTVDVLSSDKEFLAALDDPALLERVRRGDVMALANDERFNWLATRVLEELRRP